MKNIKFYRVVGERYKSMTLLDRSGKFVLIDNDLSRKDADFVSEAFLETVAAEIEIIILISPFTFDYSFLTLLLRKRFQGEIWGNQDALDSISVQTFPQCATVEIFKVIDLSTTYEIFDLECCFIPHDYILGAFNVILLDQFLNQKILI